MDSQGLAERVGDQLQSWAEALGFTGAAVASLSLEGDLAHLCEWLARGWHGTMAYMARDPQLRATPRHLRPTTLSVISVRMPYWPGQAADASEVLADGTRGYIARYALGRDYHRTVRGRLLKLGRRLEREIGPHGYRVAADSAPLLEKAIARNARLGWIGKNTLLLERSRGSWFLLGELLTDLPLPASPAPPSPGYCGSCQACLEICPTRAIVAPYRLDARRCISYLTIEHRGSIPVELRAAIGNRIFGCDDCQLVCPWNREIAPRGDSDFAPRHGLDAAALVDLFAWSESEYLAQTEGMALRRVGYVGWLRNVAVALGNAPADPAIDAALNARALHPSELVREHVAWAIAQRRARGCSALDAAAS